MARQIKKCDLAYFLPLVTVLGSFETMEHIELKLLATRSMTSESPLSRSERVTGYNSKLPITETETAVDISLIDYPLIICMDHE